MAPVEWSGGHGVQLPGVLAGMLLFDNALCSFVGDPSHCQTYC